MSVGSNAVLNRLERLLLNDPSTQSPKIHTLRKAFPDYTDSRLRGILKRADVQELFDSFSGPRRSTVLVIGDLHAPFTLKGYLEHCQAVYASQRCNKVIQIGDVLTMHRSSYHESELDAKSVEEEMVESIEALRPWGKAFPDVNAVFGNHDLNLYRKMKTAELSLRWLRPFGEALELPWKFSKEIIIDNVVYRHKAGSSPNAAALSSLKKGRSLVGGHIHTRAGVVYVQGNNLFGCLVGCGVERDSYDQRYADDSLEDYALSCAVVYEGQRAAIFPMS